MPRRIVDFHPEAIAEAREARRWYASRSPQADERFRRELEKAIAAIRDTPETWASDEDGLRRLRLARFPYSLLYATADGDSLVVAVAHSKRRPGYWKTRTEEAK